MGVSGGKSRYIPEWDHRDGINGTLQGRDGRDGHIPKKPGVEKKKREKAEGIRDSLVVAASQFPLSRQVEKFQTFYGCHSNPSALCPMRTECRVRRLRRLPIACVLPPQSNATILWNHPLRPRNLFCTCKCPDGVTGVGLGHAGIDTPPSVAPGKAQQLAHSDLFLVRKPPLFSYPVNHLSETIDRGPRLKHLAGKRRQPG